MPPQPGANERARYWADWQGEVDGAATCRALAPLMPFLFNSGGLAVALSIALGSTALLGTGAAVVRFSGRSTWRTGLRRLAPGLLAAGVVFGIGKVVGAAIAS